MFCFVWFAVCFFNLGLTWSRCFPRCFLSEMVWRTTILRMCSVAISFQVRVGRWEPLWILERNFLTHHRILPPGFFFFDVISRLNIGLGWAREAMTFPHIVVVRKVSERFGVGINRTAFHSCPCHGVSISRFVWMGHVFWTHVFFSSFISSFLYEWFLGKFLRGCLYFQTKFWITNLAANKPAQ